MTPQIKPHRVVLQFKDNHIDHLRQNDAYLWATEHAGVDDMDHGDWHMTSFECESGGNIYIYRFIDLRVAILFKLTWGGHV